MDRVKAVKKIIREQFGGNQAEFARKIGRSPNMVWQYLNNHRQMGEKFARHVESSLRLRPGMLDEPEGSTKTYEAREPRVGEIEFGGTLEAWDSKSPHDPDDVDVPLFREVELAAGSGSTQVVENHGAKLKFAKSTLKRVGVQPENAACAFVTGNSMEPVIPDGSTIGVDKGDTRIRDGKMYALDHDGMLRVKILYRQPGGGIKLVSVNSVEHPPEDYSHDVFMEHIRILGRVFWWSVLDM